MPKIVKTFKSASSSQSQQEAFNNIVKSVGAAMGRDFIKINDTKYYLATDYIGFHGFCILLEMSSYNGRLTGPRICITTQDSSGAPNESDPNNIRVGADDISTNSLMTDYNPATCVLFMDPNKDSISFSVMLSAHEDGSDVSEQIVVSTSLKAFLAKDVNGGILCGVGDSHFNSIRTKDASTFVDTTDIESGYEYDIDIFPTCLHLTKMVNYLSPGYPEMISSYVCVVRPQDGYVNESYYADGSLWGFAGYYPAKLPSGVQNLHSFVKAMSPFVKY